MVAYFYADKKDKLSKSETDKYKNKRPDKDYGTLESVQKELEELIDDYIKQSEQIGTYQAVLSRIELIEIEVQRNAYLITETKREISRYEYKRAKFLADIKGLNSSSGISNPKILNNIENELSKVQKNIDKYNIILDKLKNKNKMLEWNKNIYNKINRNDIDIDEQYKNTKMKIEDKKIKNDNIFWNN